MSDATYPDQGLFFFVGWGVIMSGTPGIISPDPYLSPGRTAKIHEKHINADDTIHSS